MFKVLKTVLKERWETKNEALSDRIGTYCTKLESTTASTAACILDCAIDGTKLGLELIGGTVVALLYIGALISDDKES